MAKILKNTTGSIVTITDVGATVSANGQITIDPSAYNIYAASSSVVTLIGNGTLVVNDGSVDLTIAGGINLIEGLFPTDGSTSTKQTPANASLASIDAKTPALGSSQAVTGTFWQATQPVSGTFWQATQPVSGTVAVTGTFWQATQPVSGTVTATGTFWQSTQPVSGTFWQATQPVSGTVTANAGTGTLAVSAASLPLPAGAATSAKQPALGTAGAASADVVSVQGVTSMTALKTDGSGVTQPVSGTFWPATQPVSGTVAVTGTFWQATQPVSGTFWQATQPVSGTVTANQGGTWTVQPGNTANTTAWKVDGSAVTQPVSGTFWQGTQPVSGTFWQATQPVSAASLPLPSGASTSAKQPALGTAGTASADVISVQGVTSMTALKVDGSAVTQPVSGTFWLATQPVSGTFWQATQPVSGTFWQTTQPVSKTDGTKATYSGGVAGLAVVTGGTDIFTITGSATKTIRITKLEISGTAATAVSVNFSLVKRSAADSGGTSASQTAVPLDSNNAAATATLLSYTASPTSLGAAVGTVRTLKVVLPVSGTFASTVCETFGDISQAVVLRGTAQQLAVNMNAAAVTTGNVDVWVEWTEE